MEKKLWIVEIEGEYTVNAETAEQAIEEAITMAYGGGDYPIGDLHLFGKPVSWIKARPATAEEVAEEERLVKQAEMEAVHDQMIRWAQ